MICDKGASYHGDRFPWNIHENPAWIIQSLPFNVGRHKIIQLKNKWCAFYFAAGGRFEVDERSGVVRTRGTDLFQLDMEYVLYVKAEDQNGRIDERRFQSTPEERLSIVGGKRAPQFYMTAYEAEIPENQKKDSE